MADPGVKYYSFRSSAFASFSLSNNFSASLKAQYARTGAASVFPDIEDATFHCPSYSTASRGVPGDQDPADHNRVVRIVMPASCAGLFAPTQRGRAINPKSFKFNSSKSSQIKSWPAEATCFRPRICFTRSKLRRRRDD
jgi:hypothetical protein